MQVFSAMTGSPVLQQVLDDFPLHVLDEDLVDPGEPFLRPGFAE